MEEVEGEEACGGVVVGAGGEAEIAEAP